MNVERKLTKEQLNNEIKFVNPVSHSHFSIPYGVGNVKMHLKQAKKLGHAGYCLTDIGSLAGMMDGFKYSKELEKFPFAFGAELNIIDSLENRDKVHRYFNIVCIAKNMEGYKNLCRLISESGKPDHFYYKPRISLEELIEKKEGLIVLSGNMRSMIAESIIKKSNQEDTLIEIFKTFFQDDFYIQLNYMPQNFTFDWKKKDWIDVGFDPQALVNERLIELSKKHNVKTLLNQNAFMPESHFKLQQDILLSNHEEFKGKGYAEKNIYCLKSVEEMYDEISKKCPYISDELFVDSCKNSIELINKAKNIKLNFKPALPKINYDENEVNLDIHHEENFYKVKDVVAGSSESMLNMFDLAEKDAALKTTIKIIIKNDKVDFAKPEYMNRLAFELKVIQRNGVIQLLDYFLLLEDVTHFVYKINKSRGYGRGSGAGSLLAFSLGITDVDPLEYGLLFERFLTKERIGKLVFEHPNHPKNKLQN